MSKHCVAISWDGQFIEIYVGEGEKEQFFHLTESDAATLRDQLTRYLTVMELRREIRRIKEGGA